MRLNGVRRFGIVGALIVFVPSSASAAKRLVVPRHRGKRCATVWWDESADTFRARAKITDVAGGGNYEVRVTNVKLQRTGDLQRTAIARGEGQVIGGGVSPAAECSRASLSSAPTSRYG